MTDKADRIRQTRDSELDRQRRGLVGRLPSPFTTAVVGVSFTSGYPDNLLSLEEAWLDSDVRGEALSCVIVRNPDNQYDANACEVHVPALGVDNAMVGHITKSMASRLAPEIDAGQVWQGWVWALKLHPDHLDRPGLEIKLERRKEDAG